MAEIDTIFSDNEGLFEEATPVKKPLYSEDEEESSTRICGGAVFSKLRTLGSGKKHNKMTDKKKHKKRNSGSHQRMSSSRDENSVRPSIVVPGSIALSSMSNPSVSSSPWLTEDDFYNEDAFRRPRGATNPLPPTANANNPNDTSHSRREDLQKLLNEMKDLNCKVKESSSVLQQGFENIAIELQEEDSQHLPKQKNNDEIEQLKQERSIYRSEAETLRMEMKDIKEQLRKIREFLPQIEPQKPPQTTASTATTVVSDGTCTIVSDDDLDSIGIPDPYAQKKPERNSPRFLETIDHAPRILETIDYPPVSDAKLSFRSEIREIASNCEPPSSSTRMVLGQRKADNALRNAEAIIQQHHHNQPVRSSDNEKSALSKTKPVVSRKPRFHGRSLSPMSHRRSLSPLSRQSYISDSSQENRRSENQQKESVRILQKADQFVEKTAEDYLVPADKRYLSHSPMSRQSNVSISSQENRRSENKKESVGSGQNTGKHVEKKVECNFMAADKKYRQLRRSLRHVESATANNENESTVSADSSQSRDQQHGSDLDDQYLANLRKSWYDKQGISLNSSVSSDHTSTSNLRTEMQRVLI